MDGRNSASTALRTVAVMANVFKLNLCYDVPVKLFSFQLLLLAIVVAAPDVPRLVAMFLLLNRGFHLVNEAPFNR